MFIRAALATGLVALGIVGAEIQKPLPEAVTKQVQELKKELPNLKEAFSAFEAVPPSSSTTGPLPEASLTEPFEIGEALYDPGRVANAVVSLLALMQVAVVPDASANTPATTGQAGLTLSESEVRALITLAREDLEGSDDIENLPHSFGDLHAAVAELLPGVSAEQLAQTYSRAYEERPDDLIPKAMMGRPIEPDMKISRAQIWFLLMDGFAGAAATNGRWGTADKLVPDLKSPNAQWTAEEFREVLARLPLVTASRLVTLSAPDVISQGATAGPPVNVIARVNASGPPLVSRATGRTLIAPRGGGSLAGQEVTWHLHEESLLHEIGKAVTPVGEAARVAADGIARFAFQPGADATKGAGELVDDWEPVDARFETRGLVASAYAVPAALAPLTIGTSRARANVHLRWRSPAKLYLYVSNVYQGINFEIPGLGGGTRTGVDQFYAELSKRADGSYVGPGAAIVNATQTLRGGPKCQKDSVRVLQKLHVKVEPQSGFGPTHILEDFLWTDADLNPVGTMATTRPDGGYYRLMISPVTEPPFGRQCISIIPAGRGQRGWGAEWFIPFNDAQWTTPEQGYGLALRSRGLTTYVDTSSLDPLGLPLPEVKAAFKLTGWSVWVVNAAPTSKELQAIK
jgi:hypothetical protein